MSVKRAEFGISLVEALVALVVLSIGMLGIAGLFVDSVRNSRTALLRTQAVNLVADMADRIRANANAGVAYDMASYADAPATQNCAPTASTAGANCSLAELAEDDLSRWQATVLGTLPTAAGQAPVADVEFNPGDPNEPDRYTISVSWGEPSETERYSYSSEVVLMPRPPV